MICGATSDVLLERPLGRERTQCGLDHRAGVAEACHVGAERLAGRAAHPQRMRLDLGLRPPGEPQEPLAAFAVGEEESRLQPAPPECVRRAA